MSTKPSRSAGANAGTPGEPAASNFLRSIVEDDLASRRYTGHGSGGAPACVAAGPGLPPQVRPA